MASPLFLGHNFGISYRTGMIDLSFDSSSHLEPFGILPFSPSFASSRVTSILDDFASYISAAPR